MSSDGAALSAGAVSNYLKRGRLPPPEESVFRLLGIKRLADNKYRVAVTDGEEKFNQGLILLEDEDAFLPAKGDLVDFRSAPARPNQIHCNEGRDVWIVRSYKLLSEEAPGTPRRTNRGGGGAVTPPRPPAKRSQEEEEPRVTPPKAAGPSPPGGCAAPLAKRSLFSNASAPTDGGVNKATHAVKDLTPYQNKYTVRARCTNKGDLVERSSSRWCGHVFNLTLQDETGDIRATAFEDHAKKFHPMFEEGKVYYVSHAQVKPIHNPRFNNTSHQYELNLNQNTVVLECANATGVPKALYSFTKICDIQSIDEREKVDVLGVCHDAGVTKEITTRAGKQVTKRDITLVDDSPADAEIRTTLWADKAESFDAQGKVVAFKSAQVSDFNGKSLNLSFGGSLEVSPELPEADRLLSWYTSSYRPTNSNNSLNKSRNYGKDEDPVTIGEMKLGFGGSTGKDTSYLTLDCYLTSLEMSGTFAYKACQMDGCNKKVEERDGGIYYCPKCRLNTDFGYRYVLRGQFADETGNQWFTAFDEVAGQMLGAGAKELVALRDTDNAAFIKKVKAPLFARLRCRVSAKTETYNDSNRLKVVVLEARAVERDREHVEKLKAEIDRIKTEMGVA